MSNNYFKFKQFTIVQDGCAMKVGTDGCLLGGWFNCAGSRNVLDIGCGSGLIAIMAAQRCNAQITGIEIDRNASLQARENVAASPWAGRIEIINSDFLEYENDEKRFDTIVCNPPYFVNSLKCDKSSRTLARHSDSLNCNDFFAKCAEVSTADSTVSIIIPCDIAEEWQSAAEKNGFNASRITYIKTTPKKDPKRVLMEFARNGAEKAVENTLVFENGRGEYSEETKEILRDFYLKIE